MDRLLQPLARLALGAWIGAVAAIAFVVAPRVFRFLDDAPRSGDLLAPVFRKIDLFGIGAAVLFALATRRSALRALPALVLGALAAANAFFLNPRIAARDAHMDLYHRLSESAWGVVLLGGIVLFLLGTKVSRGR